MARCLYQAIPRTCLAPMMALLVLAGSPLAAAGCQALPHAAPDQVGIAAERLARIEPLVAEAIAAKKLPGCVICIGRGGRIAYLQAFGHRQIQPEPAAMTVDTVFDLASLTKPIATATAVMKLVEDGGLALMDRASLYLPEFAPRGKDAISIEQLLTHQSGLIADNPLSDYADGPDQAWAKICDLPLVEPVGDRFRYSDVNYIVLGKLVERVSGRSLDEYTRATFWEPLGMEETGFNPAEALRARAAPTEQRDGEWIRGEVHDPRAFALGGVAGHAGLFSTATDLAQYAQMMLGKGTLSRASGAPVRILSPATVVRMTRGERVSSGLRGLGWDIHSPYSRNRGDLLSPTAFGHGGFTGTVLWIDPELDLFYIFLSNRLHPDGQGSVNDLAGRIANVVVTSLVEPSGATAATAMAATSERPPVQTGIDRLVEEQFRSLAGQRIGLITNHTGRGADGRSTLELFRDAPNLQLTAIFSPEHGLGGNLDVAEIADSRDPQTGVHVYSLYGAQRAPTAEMLADVDTLVFDIQDIGTRFYTYISTMGLAMQAAAAHQKRFVVLDRPNPINGLDVSGPMLDAGAESFVGFHRLPVRHGMTVGELAMLFREELQLPLDLEVVRCTGWRRADFWDATGLTWINPSPNMRTPLAALLYPGIGLLETTNVSVGRGTDRPFELFGAPWLDHRRLAQTLNTLHLPGVAWIPIEFTPTSSTFAGELCRGILIEVTSRERLDPVRAGFAVAVALRAQHPAEWMVERYGRLLGSRAVCDALQQGAAADQLWEQAQADVAEFLRTRQRFLLYER